MTRRTVRRSVRASTLLALTSIVAGLVGVLGAARPSSAEEPGPQAYRLLQMNLCLSGIAGCYPGTRYPAVVDEAIADIRANRPDVATLVETCSLDAQRIADETGYHLAFGTVIYKGAPLPCVKPEGRGVYGISVLGRQAIRSVDDRAYQAQNGNEQRRRVCATFSDGTTGCVTHLAVRDADPAGPNSAANDGQCAEFRALLDRYATAGHPVIAAGDMNRQGSCAPRGFWTLQDEPSSKDPGLQHAYGSQARLHLARGTVLPTTYSDHNALLVDAVATD